MKTKNKIVILFLIVFSVLAVFTTVCFAETTGRITGITVRLRETPSTDAKILTNLDKDNKVTVLEKSGEWYKVSYKENTGYVFEEYLEVSGEAKENATAEETTTSKEETKQEETSSETIEIKLNSIQKIEKDTKIYSLPLLSANTTDNLKKDAQVNVLQILNNWVYITSDNKTGWIVKQSIATKQQEETKQEESSSETTTEETAEVQEEKKQTVTEKKIKYVNVENANVREKPTTDSEHITTLTLNTEVVVLGEEENWYKIEVDKKQAYIYKKLVSDEKTKETTSRSTTQERTSTAKEENETTVIKEDKTESNTTSNSATGASVVEYAKQFLGAKYVSGGNGPTSFDCSGFTCYVYKHFGYSLDRTTGGQASNGTKVEKSNMQLGDIVVFLNDSKTQIGHVGIYIGNNTFIHAANASRGVVTDSVDSSYYGPRFVTARRILN